MIESGSHLAFICPRFAQGNSLGGAEVLLRRLAEHAAAQGCKITFLTTCAENHHTWENTLPAGKKIVGDLEIHYFPVDSTRNVGVFLELQSEISNGGSLSPADEQRLMANSVTSRALCEYLAANCKNYERIIMGPYLFGLTFFASQVCPEKTRLVPCLHDEPMAYLEIMQTMFSAVAGFLFNSEPEQTLAQKLFKIPDEKCHVVGMGLELFDADPNVFAQSHGITQPYVLYSGRREPMKGTPLLMDYLLAFRARNFKDLKLVLTGSGNIEPPPGLDEHIVDVGIVSEKEKQEAMAGALVFCQPSTYESFGIVALEAWLARTPVMVHGGSAVLKDHCQKSRGGLWFCNYPEFEEELLLLMNHPELRQTLGESGRKYVAETYSWPAIETKFFNAL